MKSHKKSSLKNNLYKLLRSCSAHWICDCKEPIISLLKTKHGQPQSYEVLTKWAVDNGWVTSRIHKINNNDYEGYYFTVKGVEEVLAPLKIKTCISGRAVN